MKQNRKKRQEEKTIRPGEKKGTEGGSQNNLAKRRYKYGQKNDRRNISEMNMINNGKKWRKRILAGRPIQPISQDTPRSKNGEEERQS